MKIIKTAEFEQNITAEKIANYIDSLKFFQKKINKIDTKIKKAIEDLPNPEAVRIYFSEEECNIVFDTIKYLWKKITNEDLDKKIKKKNHSNVLEGNYWMFNNGILLKGINHYTIIKKNINMFANTLKISPIKIHEKLASEPNQLIKKMIELGAIRVMADKDANMWFQLSPNTYSTWGRKKIKKMEAKEKYAKIVDLNAQYKGWETGIVIKI